LKFLKELAVPSLQKFQNQRTVWLWFFEKFQMEEGEAFSSGSLNISEPENYQFLWMEELEKNRRFSVWFFDFLVVLRTTVVY
jgi:hypothetical protein